MKTLVVGHHGMLAQSLVPCLQQAGFTVVSQGRPGLDIAHLESTYQLLTTMQPDIVINAAAYTAVDQAESEKDQAFAVNRDGPRHLAAPCREMGIPLIHVSTDYVFDGTARKPYREDANPVPLGVYGESKWQGEAGLRARHQAHLIIRTAWLYSHNGRNFVTTMLRLGREQEVLRVVNDQVGCPTYSRDLAEAIAVMCQRIRQDQATVPWGTYHYCSAGQITWYDFALAIFEEAQAFEQFRVREIVPIPTTDYPTPAQRPAYSVLDCSKIQSDFGITPRLWRDSLRACVQDLHMHIYTPRNVLITGGAGFIGCHFVRHLLRTDAQLRIVNLDLLTYAGSLDNLDVLPDPERHEVVKGTICDRPLVDRLLREHDIDTIVHFAAESHVDRSITGPAAFIETNVVGTFTLLEAARDRWLQEQDWHADQCRFHHVSTDEVYGALDKDEPPFCETTPYAPNSPYAASKASADHLVRAYHQTYGLPTITTNCSNNYGPYQHHEKLIPTVIRSCLQGQPIPVYGDGSNMRDWLYVEDHCAAIDLILRRGRSGETYNIGGDHNWNNLDVVHLICKVLAELTGRSADTFSRLIHFVADRPGHDWRYAIDATKLREELGWSAAETFETGMRKTAAWYLTQYGTDQIS